MAPSNFMECKGWHKVRLPLPDINYPRMKHLTYSAKFSSIECFNMQDHSIRILCWATNLLDHAPFYIKHQSIFLFRELLAITKIWNLHVCVYKLLTGLLWLCISCLVVHVVCWPETNMDIRLPFSTLVVKIWTIVSKLCTWLNLLVFLIKLIKTSVSHLINPFINVVLEHRVAGKPKRMSIACWNKLSKWV